MKRSLKFFSFWLILALCTAAVIFNSCRKDNNHKRKYLTFDKGVMINSVKWATRNVGAPGTFAAQPEDPGMLYQWNRKKAWATTGNITDWNATVPEGTEWSKANDPSPDGWRVPTLDEIKTLLDTAKVNNEWIIVNGINGRKFTDKDTGNSVFLPAVCYRGFYDGMLYNRGDNGNYWSSTQYGSDYAYYLKFYSGNAYYCGNANWYGWNYRECGFSVRSVAE